MTSSALILFAHGARDPQWAAPLERLAMQVAAREPGRPVRLAYLELMAPNLENCVDELAAQAVARIVVVPAFISRGAHLRRDLPLQIDALRARHPGIVFEVAEALGEAEPVQAAMADWIATLA